MSVGLAPPAKIHPIDGIKLSTAAAGIRYQGRDDLVLIGINAQASVAAVFTQNKFRAAPVEICVRHLEKANPRYLIINAGNANAGTGQLGYVKAEKVIQALALALDVDAEQILPFSTGVIGELLDADKVIQKIPFLVTDLQADAWISAAQAIMTTDTVAKAFSQVIALSIGEVRISGMAKGSGMIQPNMATMLAYIGTDLEIEQTVLQQIFTAAIDHSFNSITVDGDTSTNDACVLIATGTSGITFQNLPADDKNKFIHALQEIMQQLAQAIVRDGEGASKFVSVKVTEAGSVEQARKVAFAVANSPLVKTALAASDPNWGRIMAAAGNAQDLTLDLAKASLDINAVSIWKQGALNSTYTEEAGKHAMLKDEIVMHINLGLGTNDATIWTTDLTHEYIRINAEYRS